MKKNILIFIFLHCLINLNAENKLTQAFAAENNGQYTTAFNLYTQAIKDMSLSFDYRTEARINKALMYLTNELGRPNYIHGRKLLLNILRDSRISPVNKGKVLYNIAELYQDGLGVKKSNEIALAFYNQLINLHGANPGDIEAAKQAVRLINKKP
ncbi:MAG: hypothetical protein P4L22_04225 [Candidatus Babeliales bacterium]|nr:hypothetical protein [Candidatus Babeliales bacterium]